MIASVRFYRWLRPPNRRPNRCVGLVVPRRLLVFEGDQVAGLGRRSGAQSGELRAVELPLGEKERQNEMAEIVGGLQPTDTLIATNLDRVRPGLRVRIAGERALKRKGCHAAGRNREIWPKSTERDPRGAGTARIEPGRRGRGIPRVDGAIRQWKNDPSESHCRDRSAHVWDDPRRGAGSIPTFAQPAGKWRPATSGIFFSFTI